MLDVHVFVFPHHVVSRTPPPPPSLPSSIGADGDLVHDVGGAGVRDDPRKEQPPGEGLGVHGADSYAGRGSGHHHHPRRGGSSAVVAFPKDGRVRGGWARQGDL